ncbi:MAG: IS4 family transposase [Phycisphaerae bacterium]
MNNVSADPRISVADFTVVANAFLADEGLPFSSVLSSREIEATFAEHHGLFATDDIYSTALVLWAFLAQVLRDGKGAACAAAVADIAQYLQQTGGAVPCGDTGDYCRARAKLDLNALRQLVRQTAQALEQSVRPEWLWQGLHPKLVDGFTFTMLDTPENQQKFPQVSGQRKGVGLPIARACGVLSLATAALLDLAVGPYQGKKTGETALFRQLSGNFTPGDVAVFDRFFCSYWILAELLQAGVQVCTRLHQGRHRDFRRGKRLGKYDHLVTWTRPPRPEWMSREDYQRVPPTLTLRELRVEISAPGCRCDSLTVITTLTDPKEYSKEAIAELYGHRWNVELDIRHIKQTLHLDHVACKSPGMVLRHLWVSLLAYNLIRKVIATAAAEHDQLPRHLGFTLACQEILASWLLIACGGCRDRRGHWEQLLTRIAANRVANRPGRTEPRVIKRRRHHYPLMTRPRHQPPQKLIPA